MAEITAKVVNELRAKTGQGMMECKKMLTESSYVIGEAIKKADVFSAKLREEVTVRMRAELKKRGKEI
jgi:translation elongation factor EF-Ts